MRAGTHPRQAERLRALHGYGILDTAREAAFDEIVDLAASVCEAPVSVVNLVDADRQWFKAERGLGARESGLDVSICAHIILQDDFAEIRDTLLDARTTDNPVCSGAGGIRFYAGALLRTEEGLPIGTLCVLDTVPRDLTEVQRAALQVLARQVMAQIELRRARRDGEVLRQEVDHRVRNSLQQLSALALLENEATENEAAREMLAKMLARIGTVASLHDVLQSTAAGGSVELDAYVRRIADLLRALAPAGVALEVDAAPVKVSARQSSAVGILVNELVANAFKHGFQSPRAGGRHGAPYGLSASRWPHPHRLRRYRRRPRAGGGASGRAGDAGRRSRVRAARLPARDRERQPRAAGRDPLPPRGVSGGREAGPFQRVAVSSQIVTGPSLTSLTAISAPKRPVATAMPWPRSASAKRR
jgi:two-component sensor histidine kinase